MGLDGLLGGWQAIRLRVHSKAQREKALRRAPPALAQMRPRPHPRAPRGASRRDPSRLLLGRPHMDIDRPRRRPAREPRARPLRHELRARLREAAERNEARNFRHERLARSPRPPRRPRRRFRDRREKDRAVCTCTGTESATPSSRCFGTASSRATARRAATTTGRRGSARSSATSSEAR